MTDTQTIQKGIRRSELKVFMKLFPVFRRYLKDRDSAKKNPDGDWSYTREINGRRAVDTFIDLGPTFTNLKSGSSCMHIPSRRDDSLM